MSVAASSNHPTAVAGPPSDVVRRVCSQTYTDKDALEVFQRAYDLDPAIDIRLLNHVRHTAPEWLARGLWLLTQVSSGTRLVSGLLPLLSRSEAPVRAQVAMLLARARPNPDWAIEMMSDPDARVRANVVEGAREWCTRALVRRALEDPHPRVVCNAVVNLHDESPEEALGLLRHLVQREDWTFRAAAAWACGATLNPDTAPLVTALRSDENAKVRWNALRALTSLHRAAKEPSEEPK